MNCLFIYLFIYFVISWLFANLLSLDTEAPKRTTQNFSAFFFLYLLLGLLLTEEIEIV